MDATEQAIDQSFRIVLLGAEYTLRLSGTAALRIAAALWSIATTQQRTRGKARLAKLLKDGKELKVFSITEAQLKDFAKEAKRYGVLYAVIKGTKENPDALVDVMVKAADAAKINRIAEKLAIAEFDESDVVVEVEREQDRSELVTLGGLDEGTLDKNVLNIGGVNMDVSNIDIGGTDAFDRGVLPKNTDALLDEILANTNREAAGQPNPTEAKTEGPAPSEPSSKTDGQPQNRTSAEANNHPQEQGTVEADAAVFDNSAANTRRTSKTREGSGFGEGRERKSVRAKIAQKRRDRAQHGKDAEKPAKTRQTRHQAPATKRRRKPKSKATKGR
jgi:hypothetical protein